MADLPIPPLPGTDEAATLDWCQQAVKEGDDFLRVQPGYELISEAMDAILGAKPENILGRLSKVKSNRLGKIAEDLAALMTDTKPFWEYRTKNAKYERQQQIIGNLATDWYYRRQADMRFGDCIKYWTVGGTAWAHVEYNNDLKDVDLVSEDPRDVLPIRPSGYETIQAALGVVRRRERTVNYVHALFPDKAHLIKADRDGSLSGTGVGPTGRLMRDLGMTPFQRALWNDKPAREIPRIPVVDLYTLYVRDDRVNESSHDVLIGQFDKEGEPKNNWSYKVPPGQPLYPRKRSIIFTKTAVLYDSTSIYWHGMFPLSKLTLSPWPWSWFGKAPVWDLLPLQSAYDKTLRAIDDLLAKMVQPDLVTDKMSMSRHAVQQINTRQAGVKLFQGVAGRGSQLVYPQAQIDAFFKTAELLQNEMETISGVRDMSQLMRLNQLPGADTVEKLIESMTASMRGRSRVLEAFIREFATILAYDFAQFYTLPMRLQILGPSGVTMDDFDYDPGTFIPQYVHGDDFDGRGIPTAEALARGPLPRYERAREFMRQFSFHVAPGSLLASSEIERKMMYLQLSRAGLIDHWTLLEVLGIPNVGEPPGNAKTITERLLAEQSMMLGMQVSAAGRKASGQELPRMAIKES